MDMAIRAGKIVLAASGPKQFFASLVNFTHLGMAEVDGHWLSIGSRFVNGNQLCNISSSRVQHRLFVSVETPINIISQGLYHPTIEKRILGCRWFALETVLQRLAVGKWRVPKCSGLIQILGKGGCLGE